MGKRIDEEMLLRAEPILSANKTIDDLKDIKIELNLLDKDKKTLNAKPLERTIPKAEETKNIKDILKKYNSTFDGKYIIKYEITAKQLAKDLGIEETDEKYKQISYLSFRIDADCSGTFDKTEAEKWFDVAICKGITKEMLNSICPNAGNNKELIDALNKYCCQYDINTPLRIAHFLSQTAEETGCYKNIKSEELSYSAKRMREIFGCIGGENNYDNVLDSCSKGKLRDKLWTEENKYAHNPENLGNYVYANRIDLGNGDEASGDGYKYRGRGIIQLTGKIAYSSFSTAHNINNTKDQRNFTDKDIDLIATNIAYAVESACWYWGSYRAVNKVADKGSLDDDVKAVTKKVNGGLNGLSGRLSKFHKIKEYLKKEGNNI